jgi:tetratricopeptide (TPR) repeat protein
MTEHRFFSQVKASTKFSSSGLKSGLVGAIATLMCTIMYTTPGLAADPFRTKDPRPIGDKTEAAFESIFLKGNYQAADNLLKQALDSEKNEPLAYAMKASLAYTSKDFAGLESHSKKTREIGEKLISQDPLRGNLYTAVGHFLEGAISLQRQGTVSGAPAALGKLRQVYQYLDKAEAISPNDPELNLVKGFMDLMIAVNLPFANPEQAIERLNSNAAPRYLAQRGIAIGYRDLKQYNQALDYVNKALQETAENPEIYYLKAQILRAMALKEKNPQKMQEAVTNFDKALSQKSQLPQSTVKQIERERRNAVSEIKK